MGKMGKPTDPTRFSETYLHIHMVAVCFSACKIGRCASFPGAIGKDWKRVTAAAVSTRQGPSQLVLSTYSGGHELIRLIPERNNM